MEQLWAPWRMELIAKAGAQSGCIFCDYAITDESAFADAHILVANEEAYVVLNRYPFAAGHLLVVPTRHEAELEIHRFGLCEVLEGCAKIVVFAVESLDQAYKLLGDATDGLLGSVGSSLTDAQADRRTRMFGLIAKAKNAINQAKD